MRVVIVGNAPVTRDHAALADAADLVVRFNVPATWGAGTGRRFDVWVIANGGAGRAFVRKRPFADAPYRDLPSEIWFSRPLGVHAELRAAHPEGRMSERSERDWVPDIVEANALPQRWRRFDPAFYHRCLARLREIDPTVDPTRIPSAGFLAMNQALDTWPAASVTLVGFTFEGWPAHPWEVEEAFVHRQAATGRLALVSA
jgi:hypothetical protein